MIHFHSFSYLLLLACPLKILSFVTPSRWIESSSSSLFRYPYLEETVLPVAGRSLLRHNRIGQLSSLLDDNNAIASTYGSNNVTEERLGEIKLVGAGPGDPDLLTLGAMKALQSATLVIADRLISPEILSLITCPIKVANKKPGCAEEAQDEINRWVIEAVHRGEKVVRLKIGDPFLFGRGGEEILEYRKHRIHAEVIPGISSSYAAPLVSGIPLTHRGVSSSVLISTGYGRNGTTVEIPEYEEERTLVLLMAVGRIEEIARTLMEVKGYPADLPVSIIEKATTPEQRNIEGTLQNITRLAEEHKAVPPATIVIGHVVTTLD